MTINVLFFGSLSEITGQKEIEFDAKPDAQTLNNYIIEQFPALRDQDYQIAVNRLLVRDNTTLQPGDEVAFLPPYAGG